MQENELDLSRFAECLLRKHLVQEKHARFYVVWVRRFLRQAPNPSLSLDDRIMGGSFG